MEQHPIVIFDGICNFCNYWVNFTIKRDKKNGLRFTPLQGKAAKTLLSKHDVRPGALSSVILVDNGKIYTQSSASLRICKYLDGGWKLLYGLMVIPKFLRDPLYNVVARNRYKWFGKRDACMIPTPEQRQRFLE